MANNRKEIDIVLKLLNSIFNSELEKSKKKVKDFGNETDKSKDEVNELGDAADKSEKKVKDFGNQTDKSSKSLKDQQKQLIASAKKFEGYANSMGTLRNKGGIAFAGLTATVGGFVKLARTQELSINQLNQSLKNTGNFSEEASIDLQNFASSLQKVTIFGDETILSAQSLIASFGFEGKSLKDLTKATLDLAAAKGMDLKSAADIVAKSVGSSTNALSRYGVEIEGAAGSSERAQSAVSALSRLFGGQAEAAADGWGKIIQLGNAMGDLGEVIAEDLKPQITFFIDSIFKLVDFMGDNKGVTSFISKLVLMGTLISGLVAGIGIFGGAFLSGIAIIQKMRAAMVLLNLSFLTSPITIVLAGIGAALFLLYRDYKNGFKGITSITNGFGELIGDVGEAITGVLDKISKVTKSTGKSIKKVFGDIVGYFEGVWKALSILYKDYSKYFKVMTKILKSFGKVFEKVGNFISDVFDSMGKWAKSTVDYIGKAFSYVFDYISKPFQKAARLINTILEKLGRPTIEFGNIWKNTSGVISNSIDDVKNDFSKLSLSFSEDSESMKDGFKSMMDSTVTVAKSGYSNIKDFFKSSEVEMTNTAEVESEKRTRLLEKEQREKIAAMEEANKEMFELGKKFTSDFQGTITSEINKMFTDSNSGVGKLIRDNLSILGAETGGFLAGSIAQHTNDALAGLFGEYGTLKEDANALTKVGSTAAGAIGMAIGGPIGAAIGQTAFNLAANFSGKIGEAIMEGFKWFDSAFRSAMGFVFSPLISAINLLAKPMNMLLSAIQSLIDAIKNMFGNVADYVFDKIPGGSVLKSGFKMLGFAVGTPEVPYDMPANVHAGEMIVPKTFSDSIRSGQLTLSGVNSQNQSQVIHNTNNITITASGMSPEQLALQLKPYLNGQAVKNDFSNFNGVFQ